MALFVAQLRQQTCPMVHEASSAGSQEQIP